MELETQNNIVKAELIKFNEMLSAKVKSMEKINAYKPDIRCVAGQQFVVETLLKNYFNYNNGNQNTELERVCKIGDKYK